MLSPPRWGRGVAGNAWDDPVGSRASRGIERTVSVVVTHFEQPRELDRVLHALGRQTRPADQVVVADDGSREPPVPRPGVEVVTQPNRGFRAAAARNLGVRACTGDLLVLLDADTTPEPTFLERLTAALHVHPDLLVVGRRRYADLADVPIGAAVEDVGPQRELAEPGWLSQGYADTDDLRRADATSYRFVISAVMACSRWWFDQMGGFDERFVGYGGEDWDLAHRSWLAGGLLGHVRDAVAWHDGPAAGEAGRTNACPDDLLAQTIGLAVRSAPPGGAFRGLLLGAADVVMTLGPMTPRERLLTVDGLLDALPRARVALTPGRGEELENDPRVWLDHGVDSEAGRPEDWLDSGARLHLHVTRPVTGRDASEGAAAAWAAALALADRADLAASTGLIDVEGSDCAELHDLRQYRRARRWDSSDGSLLLPARRARTRLAPAAGRSLQSWLQP